MRKVIEDLRAFILMQKAVHWLVLMAFCAVSVYVNYAFDMQKHIDRLDWPEEFLFTVLLYAVHTIFAYLLYSFVSGNFAYWKKPGFLTLLCLSFLIFAFRAVMYKHHHWVRDWSGPDSGRLNGHVFSDLFRLAYLAIPISIIWYVMDRGRMPLYGCSVENHKWRLYWTLLLCMVPLIVGASFLSDFLDYYPRGSKLLKYDPPVWKILLFELFYGLDFSSIELFFRGFMVMAFARFVGMNAILPMSAFYLSIHYGKPLGEAISSFFGGTILGVISFHSRSILGGIMVHAGIAWLMELGGWIGNWVKGS